MKDWITAFVEEVIAWMVFFGEMARRFRQLVTAMDFLERDIDNLTKVAMAMRNAYEVN